MKTLYIFRTEVDCINYGIGEDTGLHFISSSVDLSFLNNLVLANGIKFHIDQITGHEIISKVKVWFFILSNSPLNNENLEFEFQKVKKTTFKLFKYTNLYLSFSYKNTFTIPNVGEYWTIESTFIELNPNGSFKHAFCLHPENIIDQKEGETVYKTDGKTIKPDFVFCVGSDNQFTQATYVHLSNPAHFIDIDTAHLRIEKTIDLNKIKQLDENYQKPELRLIFEFYNYARTAHNILDSFSYLYKIIEVITNIPDTEKINAETIENILAQIAKANIIEESYMLRIEGSLKNITKSTLKERLKDGVISLTSEKYGNCLSYEDLNKWRSFRGKITHPGKFVELTDGFFIEAYKSILNFVNEIISEIKI